MDPDDPLRVMQRAVRRLRHVRDNCAVAPVLWHVRGAIRRLELAQTELAKYRGWSSPSDHAPLTPRDYCAKTETRKDTMHDNNNTQPAPLQPASSAEPLRHLKPNPRIRSEERNSR